MENTVIKNLLRNMAICLATGGMLAACGGGDSQGPTASDAKLMADGEPCNAAWVSTTAYGGGGKVSRSGRNYTANWWTQGNDPVTSSGPAGSGQPWLAGYLCGGTTTTTKASTTTTKASTTTTKASTTTTKASTTTTKASTTTTKASTTTTKATTTTTNVSSCPAYVAGTAYASGKTVANAGGYYTCDVSGWCSSGASAYEPGVGWAWTSAWHAASASACGGTTSATTTTTKASTTTTGTGTTTTTKNTTTTTNSNPSAIRFAPYVDTSFGMSINNWSQATGENFVSLAFFNSAGGCNGSWPTSEATLISEAQALRSRGGQVIVSSGGWNASDLARSCTNAASLAATYEAVLTRLGTNYLDLDPEHGDSQNNLEVAIVDRRSAALKILQDSFAAKGKVLHVSFTIGVYPDSGLSAENLYVLQSAKNAGVNFDVVNPMIMDYYDGVSGNQMGARSILALEKVVAQLKTLLPGKTDAQYWGMMGATAMIGQNDNPTEVFTLSDAQKVLDFARLKGMARLAFWSLGRDNGGCPGNTTASPSCSGVSQSQWAFTNIFGAY